MCKQLENFTEGNLKYLRKKVTYQSFPHGVGGRATPRDLTANTRLTAPRWGILKPARMGICHFGNNSEESGENRTQNNRHSGNCKHFYS